MIDVDERDEDDEPTLDRKLNTGGISAEDSEGSYLDITLSGEAVCVVVSERNRTL